MSPQALATVRGMLDHPTVQGDEDVSTRALLRRMLSDNGALDLDEEMAAVADLDACRERAGLPAGDDGGDLVAQARRIDAARGSDG